MEIFLIFSVSSVFQRCEIFLILFAGKDAANMTTPAVPSGAQGPLNGGKLPGKFHPAPHQQFQQIQQQNQRLSPKYDETEVEGDLEASPHKMNHRDPPEVTFALPDKAAKEERRRRRRHKHKNSQNSQQPQQYHQYEDPSVVTKSTRASRTSRTSRTSRRSARSGVSDSHSVMTGMTSTSSYIHGRTKSEVSGTASSIAWKNLVDKVIMPPYQDDESRSVLTREDRVLQQGMSRRSAATLASVVSQAQSNNVSIGQSTNILDTRSTRRRGRLFNNINDNRTRRIQKQSKREAIVSPYGEFAPVWKAGRAAWSDTKSDIIGSSPPHKQSSSNSYNPKSTQSEIFSSNQSQTTQGNNSTSSHHSQSTSHTHTSRSRFRFGFSRHKRSSSPVSIAPSMLSRIEDDISPNDAADANDPGQPTLHPPEENELQICCGKQALWRPAILMRGLDYLVDIAQPDNETRRILKLGVPFTLAVVMESIFENVELALVGNFVGTNALTAYAMSDLLVGTSGEFISGLYDSSMTVCPHAIGTGNNYLCGQYLQITVWLYLLADIPHIFFWWYFTSDCVVWFGLSREIGDMAQAYTRVTLWSDIIEELSDIFFGLLEVTDHEAFSATIGIVEGLISITVITYMLYFYELTLIEIAYINVIIGTFFFILTVIIALRKGWIAEYIPGMLYNFAPRVSFHHWIPWDFWTMLSRYHHSMLI